MIQFPRPPATGQSETSSIMAVALRLNRKGTKDRPYYKIVAVDSRKRRDGRYIEQVGTYDPLLEGVNYTIDLEKADKWLGVGAKPSETVNSIIRKARTASKA
jgi:small subunit ribosomal protein S16